MPPGKKLDPVITTLTAPIYARDRIRYKNLCRWVWAQQKAGYSDQAIAVCLELGGPKLDAADDWFAYLTALLKKANGRAHESEADRHKRAEGEFLAKLLGENWQRRAG